MKILIYAKLEEDISVFKDVINILGAEDIYIVTENKRSFKELEKERDDETVYLISSLQSLGLNDAQIANSLSRFIKNRTMLVICDIPSTYEYGVSQPMNQAVLSTILQSVLNGNKNVITFKKNVGRNKLSFPDNWDELYKQWNNKEITSKQFIEMSGLKRATFYNLLTEYKDIQEAKDS